MIYLDSFRFPDEDKEWAFRMGIKRTCYTTMYPFGILTAKGLDRLDFAPLTILQGGNGSGKTTALNIIARKLHLTREAPGNSSTFMDDYAELCYADLAEPLPAGSRMIASDDVFDYMLNLRSLNDGVDRQRETLFVDWMKARREVTQLRSLADYDQLKKVNNARRNTQSEFVRQQGVANVREMSNGESATYFFRQRVQEDALYLLDEPENSLSAEKQLELADFLVESVRYAGCQLIIATHSPMLLCMPGAKIYDLDTTPASICRWTDLPSVNVWRRFFLDHENEFEEE